MVAPLARLITKMFARPARVVRRRVGLCVEALEARDVPAVWANLTGDFQAMNLLNWQFSAYEANDQLRIIEFDGSVCNVTCVGLTSGEGQFDYIGINPSFTASIVFGGPVTAYWMWQAGGTIDQPDPASLGTGVTSTDLTILQWWQWEDGTLNSTDYAASVIVDGAMANIGKGEWGVGDGIIELGSNLVFCSAAVADFRGYVNLFHSTGIDVLGGSTASFGVDTAILSALATITERQTIRVLGESSRVLTQGAATLDLGLWVGGGTVELQGVANGEARVRFRGPVREAGGALIHSGIGNLNELYVSTVMTAGKLILGEGARLDVSDDRFVVIRGGTLATRVTAGRNAHEAFITAKTLHVEQVSGGQVTQIIIGDPSLNPPGVTGHVYSTLEVAGSVDWRSGTYRPLVTPAGVPAKSSLWFATKFFRIGFNDNPGSPLPVLGPVAGQQPPPAGTRFDIIRTSMHNIDRQNTPTFEAGNTNWTVIPAPQLPAPDREFWIERT